MSEGLKRAREPYRIKNALVGLGLGAFAVGVWAYSISAVKQDEFDDVDEEAKALGAGAGGNVQAKPGEKASFTAAVPPNPISVAEATANLVLPGTVPLPPVATPSTPPSSSAPPARGVLQVLDERWPRLLDPEAKTIVWGAPSVDNVGRMGVSSRS